MPLIRPMNKKCQAFRKKLVAELKKKTTPSARKKVLERAIDDLDNVLAAMKGALRGHTIC